MVFPTRRAFTKLVGGMMMGTALLTLAACGEKKEEQAAAPAPQEVNIYSSRHYDADKLLFAAFEEKTGILVNVIEGKDDELIERLRAEGQNSPADLLLAVDAGRLWRAQDAGVLQPVRSDVLEKKVPAAYREPEGHWFGLSARARIIIYNKEKVQPTDLARYEDLADPKWQGRLLIRSSTNIYNQSLVGSIVAADGPEQAEAWAQGVVKNFARPPQGGDIDQIKAVAAGEGDIAVSNTYYLARLLNSSNDAEKAEAEKVGVIFPNQGDRGAHVNISGAGVTKHAPHKDAAIKFLEFLTTAEAQQIFAEANYEFPVVDGIPAHPVVAAWGDFKRDSLNAAVYGRNNAEALKIMDRAGWK